MKLKFFLPLLALAAVSCSGNKTAADDAQQVQEVKQLSVDGKWRLNDFAGTDQMVNIDPEQDYYLTINTAENSFNMTTDCNGIFGQIKLVGDSLIFDNLASTKMMCPSDSVESAMNTILPMITTYTITPDSALLLRSDARIMAGFKYVEE